MRNCAHSKEISNMSFKPQLLLASAFFASMILAACEHGVDKAGYEPASSVEAETVASPAQQMSDDTGTIVTLAAANKDLSTLVAAVSAAGLVDTLNSAGPFTVFAPPNSAFEKLPAGSVETLLEPENKQKLAGILTYHVVAGEVMAADLVQAVTDNGGTYTITTVNGAPLQASLVDGSVVLSDANGGTAIVTMTDIDASNGVVHLIDSVVMPG
jgi:uncharacterized surface protein with fasciclin (FAS1) repeats